MTRITLLVAVPSLVVALGCKKSEEPKPVEASKEPAASASAAPQPLALRADDMKLAHDLGPMPIPPDNPQDDKKIELGHQLFFDKRLSADGKLSCYSCHQNEDGNGGRDPIAIGANLEVHRAGAA